MDLFIERIPTPIGTALVVSDGTSLRALNFDEYETRLQRQLRLHYGEFTLTPATDSTGFSKQIRAYFSGDLTALDDVPVETAGTTFQKKVWAELRKIPVASTMTYGELAGKIGNPGASRAVGLANGSNPVAIVVPCHRVIGSGGALTGYGGGLERKQWLLKHEGASFRPPRTTSIPPVDR